MRPSPQPLPRPELPAAWLQAGAGAAAAAAAVGALTASLTGGPGPAIARHWVAAGLSLLAFLVALRRPRLGARLALWTAWAELTLAFHASGRLESPGTALLPALVVAAGLFSGGASALLMAAACAVSVPLALYTADAWGPGLSRLRGDEVQDLVGLEVLLAALAALTYAAVRAYRAAHQGSERDRERYLSLFENAADGMVAVDTGERIAEVNAVTERLLDAPREWLRGVRLDDALSAAGAEPGFDLAAARSGAPALVTLRRPDGPPRTLEISDRTDVGGEGGAALRVIRDVTERRQMEERLGHAQRMETVGGLAGGVAHDFNNLLTVVGGNAALLGEHRDPAVRELAAEIVAAHRRGVTLTRQLLAFARRELRRPEPLDLGEAVDGLRRLLERMLGEQHRLVIERAGAAPVLADRAQLEQVVVNLVANARDAMPSGGTVCLRIGALPRVEAGRLGSTLGATEQALLEVADEGVGMTTAVRARIFEPFFTTKPRGQGTGLGLAAVHGIVAQSGGQVTVDSAPGKGARFRIFLPLSTEHGPRAAADAPAEPLGGSEAVLLVEDDPGVRALARRVLEAAGYRVVEAANGAAGLAAAEALAELHAVVTDVVMPGLSGPALVEHLRRRRPDLAALFMSGYSGAGRAGTERVEAADLLPKPFEPSELLARLRAALDAAAAGRGTSAGTHRPA